MWKDCEAEADYESPLDFPKIFLCGEHYNEHRRLAKRNHREVEHPSFTQRQHDRHLKKGCR